nr:MULTISPECIES: DUF1349 domain-containing protein [unclassified Fibrobacter]
MDSENWLKASIEFENESFQHLGSVVTNMGYSDWATTAIPADVMRICHMARATDEIQFGIYACSPEDSSFDATFTEMEITECKWLAHVGQKPD